MSCHPQSSTQYYELIYVLQRSYNTPNTRRLHNSPIMTVSDHNDYFIFGETRIQNSFNNRNSLIVQEIWSPNILVHFISKYFNSFANFNDPKGRKVVITITLWLLSSQLVLLSHFIIKQITSRLTSENIISYGFSSLSLIFIF